MAPEHQDASGRVPLVDYKTDFYAWAQAQAEALRAKDWAAVDVTNLLEEVEGLAERHRSAIEHQLERLVIPPAEIPVSAQRAAAPWSRLACQYRQRPT